MFLDQYLIMHQVYNWKQSLIHTRKLKTYYMALENLILNPTYNKQ